MELAQKLETLVTGVESQTAELASVKSDINALQEVIQGLAAANDAEVEHKETTEDLMVKLYTAAKTGDGVGTELVVDGAVKSMNVTDDASAGAGVVTEVNKTIVTRILDESVLGKLFGRDTAASAKYEKRVQIGRSGMRWEGENVNGTNGAATGTPTFATIKMISGKAVAQPVVTQEALKGTFFNVEAFLLNDVRKQLGRGIATALVNGTGEHQPAGFMTYFDAVEGVKAVADRKADHYPVVVKATSAIADDAALLEALQAMQFEIPAGYMMGAKYAMSRKMFQRVASLKDGMGRPMMQKSLDAAVQGSLFGFPIVVEPAMTEDKPVVFGRFDEAFHVVDIPTSLGWLRNPYKIDFCVEFTLSTRVGTIVNDNQAVVGLVVTGGKAK